MQDVMFNNRIGVVMPLGLLGVLLKHVKPVAKYLRRETCTLETLMCQVPNGQVPPGRLNAAGPTRITYKTAAKT